MIPSENFILNLEEHNGKLYLFRRNEISILDKDKMSLKLYSSSFPSTSSMLIDLEGNSWFTSIEKGVFFKPKSEIELKLDVKYATALETIKNKLLVAHDKQFISTLNKSDKQFNHTSFKDFNRVNLIYNDQFDDLWVVRNNGLYLNGKKIANSGGYSLLTTSNTYFLTGRARVFYGIKIVDSLVREHKLPSYGLSSALIGEDSILIGTDNGLMLFHQDTIIDYAKSPLLKSRITNLVYDKKNNLWVGTGGNGLLKYNYGVKKQISKIDGLSSDIIDKVLITDDSVIWLSTSQGINKIVINDDEVNINRIDRSNGLKSYKINDFKLYGEDIYLATNDGLYSFPKNIDLNEPNDFRLFIDKVLVDNVSTEQGKFHQGIQSLQINFKALTFRNHNSLTYQYQLLPNESSLNTRWIDTDINQVNFVNLNPNKYSFIVRAKTKNSEWSAPISYSFEIVPAYWQTSWFQLLIIISVVSGLIGLIHFQNTRRLARKNLEKEILSAELKALKAQINPHFLFNVLNSIQSFILDNEKDIAQEYLVKYGRLMRMVLDHSDHLVVTLASEIEMLILYTDLEKLRLKWGFDFEVSIPPDIDVSRIFIPSMILQPFIENAIWHGLSPLKKTGKIQLRIMHLEDYIQIEIIDNGVGFDKTLKPNDAHKSSGLRLVKERLNLTQGDKSFKSQLYVESNSEGTSVIIQFSDTIFT